jgi:mycothiol S-conjugate amidase
MAPLDRDGNQLCVLAVHAHPDDEASKGSATIARYHDEGVRSVLVCCTGGEAGDILNPAVDTPEVRANLAEVRMRELADSAAAIGYDVLAMLGYHDSGMPDSDVNHRADNFANAPLDEAVGRLVAIIREERPQVIVTYGDDRKFYPHPDHIRVHEISGPAFDAAGDPDAFTGAGEPWQPSKLYYTGFSPRRVRAMHDAFVARGEESPYAQWFERGFPERDDRFTTFVDVGAWLDRRRASLLAHKTQVDPDGHWMRLPDDVIREAFPWDEYVLARSLVGPVPPSSEEDDLFDGIRAHDTIGTLRADEPTRARP